MACTPANEQIREGVLENGPVGRNYFHGNKAIMQHPN